MIIEDLCDKDILQCLKRINSFDFVKTSLSCQGHFIEKRELVPLYYVYFDEKGKYFNSIDIKSRIRFPYVVLGFSSHVFKKRFFYIWRKIRQANPFKIIILSRKFKNMINLSDDCFILSSFDDCYASVTAFVWHPHKLYYKKNSLIYNRLVKSTRDFFFNRIVKSLEKLNH